MPEIYFNTSNVRRLQVLLEEVTRAKPGSPESRFVNPEQQILDRLSSNFHHVLFGRRGAGKSSLLRHVEASVRKSGRLVAWCDQETFMGLSYPDVLVATLESAFKQFAEQVESLAPPTPPAPPRRRYMFWRSKAAESAISTTQHSSVAAQLRGAVELLSQLKSAPSESQIQWSATYSNSREAGHELSGAAGVAKGVFTAEAKGRRSASQTHGVAQEVSHSYASTKSEHLERAIPIYRELMLAAAGIAPNGLIVLDDFYRLNEVDQAAIAGYFHRVVKDTSVWLKVGSIRYWTKLYRGGRPAVGLQVPHDIRELTLDRGLLQFRSSKRFLEQVLASLAAEVDVDVNSLFTTGALDRLVLASGGVPRDYIGLLGESIANAQNRGPSAKSGTDRVIAEDVNEAAGRTVETKFNDLDEDAGSESSDLRRLVVQVTNHCRVAKSACFLVDTLDTDLIKQLNRLQNMRFVHSIDTNESLPDQSSRRYEIYLLDVSQLAAQRAWQVDFMAWQKREKRRARKLVFTRPTVDGQGAIALSAEPLVADGEPIAQSDEIAVVGEIDPPAEDSADS